MSIILPKDNLKIAILSKLKLVLIYKVFYDKIIFQLRQCQKEFVTLKKELKIDPKKKLLFSDEPKEITSIQNDFISPIKYSIYEQQVEEKNEKLQQNEVKDMMVRIQPKKELCEDEKKERIEILLQKIDEIDQNIILFEQKIDELAEVLLKKNNF